MNAFIRRIGGVVSVCSLLLTLACGSGGGSQSGTLVPGNAGALTTSLNGLSVSLSWVAAVAGSDSAGIEYKVVSSSAPNLLTANTAESNGTVVLDWTLETTSTTLTVTEGTTYLNVLARKGGKTTAYQMSKVTGDQTAPVPGANGALTIASGKLNWTAATDNVSAADALTYKVLSSEQNNLDSVANAEANGTVVLDWTANVTSATLASLTLGQTVTYTVLVRDEAKNTAIYSATSQTLTDTAAPTPGDSGTLTSSAISVTGATISWAAASDDFTSGAALEYKLVRSDSNNIGAPGDAEQNGQVVMDWTANTLSQALTGLSQGQTVFVNVLVRDASGNVASYTVLSVTTLDGTAPVPGGAGQLTFSNPSGSGVTVSWEKATDVGTPQDLLQYRLLRSEADNLGTLVAADANGTLVKDWTPNLTAVIANQLQDAKTYFFVVQVRDSAGNRAQYASASVTTLDDTPPFAGNSGTIDVLGLSQAQLTLSWTKGGDNATLATFLEYRVVRSNSNNIATAADALANGTVVKDWTANITQAQLTGLSAGTTYYVNVLVRDGAKNVGVYTSRSVTTADGTPPTPGSNGALTTANLTDVSFTLNWSKATDNLSAPETLEYRVVHSQSNNIDTVDHALANGSFATDWTLDVATADLSQLQPGQLYFVNVLVRDEAGNMALYTQKIVETLDTAPPIPGSSGTITVSQFTATGLTLTWQRATDGATPQSLLQYKVVRSSSPDIADLAGAQNASTVVLDWTTDTTTASDNSLSEGQAVYYNVLVRDEALNVAVYTMVATAADATPPTPGALGALVNNKNASRSITFMWTAATDNAPGSLSYRVVRSGSPNIGDVNSALANGTLVKDWTVDLTSITATGLEPLTTYYFNVLVRDAAGLMASYTMSAAWSTADGTPPSFPGPASAIAQVDSIVLSWTQPTDNLTATADIEIAVFYNAGTPVSPLTLEKVLAAATMANQWTANLSGYTLTPLNDSTAYSWYLVARDTDGNLVLGPSGTTTTTDGTPPIPGSNGVLTTQVGTRVKVTWPAATDNVSNPEVLSYAVYYSMSDNLNTLNDVLNNGTESATNLKDVTDWTVSGLDPEEDYWVNVLVTDENGNRAIYKAAHVVTKRYIWLYNAGLQQIDTLGNRTALDGLCLAAKANANVGTCTNARALISLGGTDTIKNVGVLFAIPSTLVELVGPDSDQAGVYAADLKDFVSGDVISTQRSLADVGVLPASQSWISFSNADGTTSSDTCSQNGTATVGHSSSSSTNRITDQAVQCTEQAYLLCICY